jgi:hypothetical protein
MHFPDFTHEREAIHPGHPVIGYDGGKLMFAEQIKCGGPGLHVVDYGVGKYRLQIPPGEKRAVDIIIYDQEAFGHELGFHN